LQPLRTRLLRQKHVHLALPQLPQLIRTIRSYLIRTYFGLGSSIENAFGGRLFTEGLDYDEDGFTDYIAFGYSKKNGDNWQGGIIFGDVRDDDVSSWKFRKYFNDTRPITAKVEFMKCFDRWYMYFGTGKWFYKTDESSLSQPNRIYGIRIECSSGKCRPNSNFAHTSQNACKDPIYSASWYINLDKDNAGYFPERNITDPTTTNQNIIIFTTMEPTADICGFGGRTRVWALNCATGGAISETCENYPINKSKGEVLLQLSGGDIREIKMVKFLNKGFVGRATPKMNGVPSPESPISMHISRKTRTGQVMLWFEK